MSVFLVIVVVNACGFFQVNSTHTAVDPRIFVALPDKVPSQSVWIRYSVTGPHGSGGGLVEPKPNLRQYVIYTSIQGGPVHHAKVVVYARGCKFGVYTLDFKDTSDVSLPFECLQLPTKIVHGFIPADQIPKPIWSSTKQKLDILAYLEDGWVCEFFLRPPPGSTGIYGGSCLGASIPLGTVGELDPTKGGDFEITIPDFTSDPVFLGTSQVPRVPGFGVIELGLHDKTFGRSWGVIRPEGSSPRRGLTVQGKYPNPVKFTAR